ncbi:MAG: hypothetical protein NZ929_07055 [Aigarchaeota archaeon]|nr:hypothetical protein [Aigarchaeota archaeon]MCX8192476.1 hypothetical protein [Nitrososphaeria archaeon]MDW7985788.1 hypothetical protein [Nitrososphaerota archaeon]
MLIAVDLDGVIANSLKVLLDVWNEETGQNIRFEEIDEWFFWKRLNIDEKTFLKFLNRAWIRWTEIPPTEDKIREKLFKLRSLGRLDIVTARSKETEIYALNWLAKHEIPYDNYVWVKDTEDKAVLEYDVYIDDSPLLARALKDKEKILLIYDQPWNRELDEGKNIKRIKDLDEAYQYLINKKHFKSRY